MNNLRQYVGRRFTELEVGEGVLYVNPELFGEAVVTEADVFNAFPPTVLGLFNTAAVNRELISEDEVGMLEE